MAERHMASPGEHIAPLSQLPEFEVTDESPDVRGWSVESADGTTIGEVDDLLIDTDQMRARYLVVELAEDDLGLAAHQDGRTILVPVDTARLEADSHRVRASIRAADAAALPRYSGRAVEADYGERFPRHDTAAGREDVGDATRMTRSAEELRVGRRKVPAGEVQVRKSVETERVHEPVTTTREDVTVERRPVSGEAGRAEIRDDEVRVPVTEEEVIVEKRPVVKEEVVIKKDVITEEQDIETDLRKERIDIDRTGQSTAADKRRNR